MNWGIAAASLLRDEMERRKLLYPEPTGALIMWRGKIYIGSVQEPVPEFSTEIAVLSKSSRPIPDDLTAAIRKLDPGRLELHADDAMDLMGRQHILRRVENRLTHMTHDQTAYMLLHPPIIREL